MSENIFYEFINQDSVFIDKNKISPHYVPDKLLFRDKQIHDLSFWLSPSLKNSKPHNIFIYGKTGTGKTTVVKHVSNQLISLAELQKLPIKFIYLNCVNYQTRHSVLFYCVQDFYPEDNFIGYSKSFIYDKFITYIRKNKINFILILDEIDKIKEKEIDGLIYTLSRSNDELVLGSVSIIGVSNNISFKSKLDPRTRSSLCELETLYPPYNADELREILRQRVSLAFKDDVIKESAINVASAIAAKESGDARTAVMLLLRAGEISDINNRKIVTDKEVLEAKEKVEEEIIKSMVLTLPTQQQLVLLAISKKLMKPHSILKINGSLEENILYSGEVYEKYVILCNTFDEKPVSLRWFREYINELEMYGFISTTISGKGMRGNTTLIKLGVNPKTIISLLKKEFSE